MLKPVAVIFIGMLGLSASHAVAAQKYVPSGHSSLEQTGELPKFGTPQADFNLQTDIYETQNYLRQKELRDWEAQLRRFDTHSDSNPSNKIIDY